MKIANNFQIAIVQTQGVAWCCLWMWCLLKKPVLIQSLEKGFLTDPLTIINAIYIDSLTLNVVLKGLTFGFWCPIRRFSRVFDGYKFEK